MWLSRDIVQNNFFNSSIIPKSFCLFVFFWFCWPMLLQKFNFCKMSIWKPCQQHVYLLFLPQGIRWGEKRSFYKNTGLLPFIWYFSVPLDSLLSLPISKYFDLNTLTINHFLLTITSPLISAFFFSRAGDNNDKSNTYWQWGSCW